MIEADVVIVGGGIVGLATAHQTLLRFPHRRVLLIEKEPSVAQHQTGHNSGVLHSGIYYRPGSSKARNCRAGKLAMQEFCRKEQIPHEICGKVIVATSDQELPKLAEILARGLANGVECHKLNRQQLMAMEPYVNGVEAIHVPEAGIVDYRAVCNRLGQLIRDRGGEILLSTTVQNIQSRSTGVIVNTSAREFHARQLINCAGLHSDRVARFSGAHVEAKIIPFRGEYYQLRPDAQRLCRNLIYPVPDPQFPFLGVHFTRMIHGGVECGPNAVLALAREGYRWSDIRLRDTLETLTYPGFWKLASRHWRSGVGEIWRSLSKRAFVTALQKLVPDVRAADLEPAPSGVRAQAVARDGAMVDDFLLVEDRHAIHVCNAPSPAATASLSIGAEIVNRLATRL